MIRTVVAVLLAVALFATALPAIETARIERSETAVQGEIDEVDAAAVDLVRSDDPVANGPGARRVVTVRLHAVGWTAAGVESVRVGTAEGSYEYRIEGTDVRTVHGRVPVRPAGGDPVVLREPGTHRLVLRLVERPSGEAVVVERL